MLIGPIAKQFQSKTTVDNASEVELCSLNSLISFFERLFNTFPTYTVRSC
jgi:hypothetical protein